MEGGKVVEGRIWKVDVGLLCSPAGWRRKISVMPTLLPSRFSHSYALAYLWSIDFRAVGILCACLLVMHKVAEPKNRQLLKST